MGKHGCLLEDFDLDLKDEERERIKIITVLSLVVLTKRSFDVFHHSHTMILSIIDCGDRPTHAIIFYVADIVTSTQYVLSQIA
jgi:hypothetical protein